MIHLEGETNDADRQRRKGSHEIITEKEAKKGELSAEKGIRRTDDYAWVHHRYCCSPSQRSVGSFVPWCGERRGREGEALAYHINVLMP